ncbi:helix-turn-helix domain-containing protein [Actinomadura geliboluensis]|uniref:helix-turn-helix domain-containing protein n=1 Tax=Actinomadura geliboluensis TaxID=882440 RepID=UPI003721181B
MGTDSGPVLSGWLLGRRLAQAREAAGLTASAVAKKLDVHTATLRRWEKAEVLPNRVTLWALCDYYEVPAEQRAELEELRERADEPGWWNGSGPWPAATAELLGMEIAAVRIRAWDLTAIPGLLQTPEYARQIMKAAEPNASPTVIDEGVRLRMSRQEQVFTRGVLREATFTVDEMAIARMPGGVAVRRAQIARLLSPADPVTIQIVPFRAGPHPALGSWFTCDFDDEMISTGVFIEGSVTGQARVETDKARIAPYDQAWAWLQSKALSPQNTAEWLTKTLESMNDD